MVNAGSYKIHLGDRSFSELKMLLAERKYSAVFILVDENTFSHCYPLLLSKISSLKSAILLRVQSGETNKTIETCVALWEKLAEEGADRHSLLINLGGGVIGDLGGFVAATYLRGIDFVQVPTTLLAQVDASVGGKLGVDMGPVKNQVGVFASPEMVMIAPAFLTTLPERELLGGYAEVIKHALIRDAKYWDKVLDLAGLRTADTLPMILRSVQIKTEVVKRDPAESGLRKILNFGHTVGHAFESFSLENDTSPMIHGEAVATGMVAEAWLSWKKKLLSKEELQEISSFLMHTYKSWNFNKFDEKRVLELMKYDKKNRAGKFRFSLLKGIGRAVFDVECSATQVRDSIEYYRDQAGISGRV